jgi:hypothetical protein
VERLCDRFDLSEPYRDPLMGASARRTSNGNSTGPPSPQPPHATTPDTVTAAAYHDQRGTYPSRSFTPDLEHNRHPHCRLSRPASERLTSPLTVPRDLGKRRSAQRWARSYSHGGVLLGTSTLRRPPVQRVHEPTRHSLRCLVQQLTSLSGLTRVQPDQRAAVVPPTLIACSAGHSGGHSTRPYCSQPDRTQRNAFPT